MKYLNVRKGVITLFIALAMVFQVKANDVELRVPKSSIQNALDAFIHARYFSYGTDTNLPLVDYYNFKTISSTLRLYNGNRFELDLIFNAYINFELLGFEHDHTYSNKSLGAEVAKG